MPRKFHPKAGRRKRYFAERECAAIHARHPTTGNPIVVSYQKDAMIGQDLDEEIIRFPGLFSWWLQLRDLAEDDFDDAKHEELNIAEDLSIRLRAKMLLRGEKPTETSIKIRVKAHPKMRFAYRKRMLAERKWRQLRSAVEAMTEKKWAMRGLVEHRRMDSNKDSY